MDSRDRFYGFSSLLNIFAEKKTYYAGIVLDAPSIVLCSKLCRHIMYLTLSIDAPYGPSKIRVFGKGIVILLILHGRFVSRVG